MKMLFPGIRRFKNGKWLHNVVKTSKEAPIYSIENKSVLL
jgi:hypothetical protein